MRDKNRLATAITSFERPSTISPPAMLTRLETGTGIPESIINLWRRWRISARDKWPPVAKALCLHQLGNLGCLPQYAGHVTPLNDGTGFSVTAACSFEMGPDGGCQDNTGLYGQRRQSASTEPPMPCPLPLLIPTDAISTLQEDWEQVRKGKVVIRVLRSDPDQEGQPSFRICLPIRSTGGAPIDAMVVGLDKRADDFGPNVIDLSGRRPLEHPFALETIPPTERLQTEATASVTSPETDAMAETALSIDTRQSLKDRMLETAAELRRTARDRPDAERRGALLEAARLIRLADRY